MKNNRRILVTGASTLLGSSVVKALLKDKKFITRVLVTNAGEADALMWKEMGAEIAEGKLDHAGSLMKAMEDCYGVFGLTDYWEQPASEYQLGKNLMDSVAASHIRHFVFNGADNYSKLSNGSYAVPQCDSKAALQEYSKTLKLYATFVQPSFYFENFLGFAALQMDEDGGYRFGFPQGNTRLAAMSVEDYGEIVRAVFNYPIEYIGRTVRTVGSDNTCAEYAAILREVLGEKIEFVHIPREEYAALDFPGAEALANLFEVQRLYIPQRQIDLIESYGLNPVMQHFRNWVIKNKSQFIGHIQSLNQAKAVA